MSFTCETEDVEFVYDVELTGAKSGKGNNIQLTPTVTISVYAKKEGHQNSEVATLELPIRSGLKGDVDEDGVVDIADAVRIVNFIVGKIPALAPRNENNLPDPE